MLKLKTNNELLILNLVDSLEDNNIKFDLNIIDNNESNEIFIFSEYKLVKDLINFNGLKLDLLDSHLIEEGSLLKIKECNRFYYNLNDLRFYDCLNNENFDILRALCLCNKGNERKSLTYLYRLIRDLFNLGFLDVDVLAKSNNKLRSMFNTIVRGNLKVKIINPLTVEKFKSRNIDTPRVTTWENENDFGYYLSAWKNMFDENNFKKTYENIEIVESPIFKYPNNISNYILSINTVRLDFSIKGKEFLILYRPNFFMKIVDKKDLVLRGSGDINNRICLDYSFTKRIGRSINSEYLYNNNYSIEEINEIKTSLVNFLMDFDLLWICYGIVDKNDLIGEIVTDIEEKLKRPIWILNKEQVNYYIYDNFSRF